MDNFLKDIYVAVFKQWILFHKSDDYKVYQHTDMEEMIIIETDYGCGEIMFNDFNVIELKVTNKITDTSIFYLHFQMQTLKHAVELFEEMMDTIKTLVVKPKVKVLLSCSSDFTTSFFAEKLNEAVELLDMNYTFDVRAYSELFDEAKDYDVILLAPQISYMQPKIQKVLKDKLVLRISSHIFAGYDVKATFDFIDEEIHKYKKDNTTSFLPNLKINVEHNDKILCIGLLRYYDRVRLVYRVYDQNNQILVDDEMLKNHVNLEDIRHLIRTILLEQPDVSLICVSKPGSADEDLLSLIGHRCDVIEYLSRNFTQKIILTNDTNDIALGYYACQDKVSSLSFMFQPMIGHSGSIGSVHSGKLIKGEKIVAGEILYNPIQYSQNYETIRKTPEGTLEWVAKNMIPIITILAPEIIVVSSPLIINENDIKEEVMKYIPEYYIPEIIKLEGLKEYLLIGQLVQCADNSLYNK